jgi:hypothetical protein
VAAITKQRPPGATILALLCFIAGGSCAFGIRAFGDDWVLHPVAAFLINPIAGMVVIVYLAAALMQAGFFIAIGIGLLKMQNWARVFLIVLIGFEFLTGFSSLLTPITHALGSSPGPALIVITSAVGALIYLFRPRVKQMFGAIRF